METWYRPTGAGLIGPIGTTTDRTRLPAPRIDALATSLDTSNQEYEVASHPTATVASPAPAGSLARCINHASLWSPLHVMESAWLEHGPFSFWLIDAVRPRRLVELGAHHGFSYLTFCQAVRELDLLTECYAVDTWKGDEHAGFYDEAVYVRLQAINAENYAAFSRLLRCTFDEALPTFEDGSIDVLHIDGRHFYEDVRHDFESWRRKLSPRGVVLFHDIAVHERDFGVWRLWDELAPEYPHFEFPHCHGLGVLAVGPEIPPALRPLLMAGPDEADLIRASYARLGEAVSLQYKCYVSDEKLNNTLAEQDRLRIASSAGQPMERPGKAQSIRSALQRRAVRAWRAARRPAGAALRRAGITLFSSGRHEDG